MIKTNKIPAFTKWLQLLFAAILIITFFLPWVSWQGEVVSGYHLPSGSFFRTSEAKFHLGNPFPKLSFALYLFWLIPVLAAGAIVVAFTQRKFPLAAYAAGAMSLALITIFIQFTKTLIDLGIGNNVWGMLKPFAYLHIAAAIGLIITVFPSKAILAKLVWLVLGPVIAYGSYKFGERFVMNETFTSTDQVKADYTINAKDLIHEFTANDTVANKKYLEKTIVVNGVSSAIELQADSTSTIKFADSTGSYAIFSLEKNQYEKVKAIGQGATVSLKGVCSGSIFSEILGTTTISFKRATLNQ